MSKRPQEDKIVKLIKKYGKIKIEVFDGFGEQVYKVRVLHDTGYCKYRCPKFGQYGEFTRSCFTYKGGPCRDESIKDPVRRTVRSMFDYDSDGHNYKLFVGAKFDKAVK